MEIRFLFGKQISRVFGSLLWGWAALGTTANANVDFIHPSEQVNGETPCATCHPRQFEEWQGSMMAYSAVSPTFNALEQMGNMTGRSNGVTVHGAFADGGVSEFFCQACHTPAAVEWERQGFDLLPPFNPNDPETTVSHLTQLSSNGGSLGQKADVALKGISCDVCHQVIGPDHGTSVQSTEESNAGLIGIANSAFDFLNTNQFSTGVTGHKFGQYADLNSSELHQACQAPMYLASLDCVQNQSDADAGGYLSDSLFCGSCHDVRPGAQPRSDDIQEFATGESFLRLENLFTEWRNSHWASGEGLIVEETSCQDCHMSVYPYGRTPGGKSTVGIYPLDKIASIANAPPRKVSSHYFTGVDISLDDNFNAAGQLADASGVSYNTQEVRAKRAYTIEEGGQQYTIHMPVGQKQRRIDLLKNAVEMRVDLRTEYLDMYGVLEVNTDLMNTGAGHNVPSGFSQERQFWVAVKITDANGDVVYKNPSAPDPTPIGMGYLKDSDNDGRLNDERLNHLTHFEEDPESLEVVINGQIPGENLTKSDFENLVYGEDIELRERGFFGNQFKRVNNESPPHAIEVFSPFLADIMDNSHSLPVMGDGQGSLRRAFYFPGLYFTAHQFPLTVDITINFRAFPPGFLEGLLHSVEVGHFNEPDLLPSNLLDLNEIIEMDRATFVINRNDSQEYHHLVNGIGRCVSSLGGGLLLTCSDVATQDLVHKANGRIEFANGDCLAISQSAFDSLPLASSQDPQNVSVITESCSSSMPNRQRWYRNSLGNLIMKKPDYHVGDADGDDNYNYWCAERLSKTRAPSEMILKSCVTPTALEPYVGTAYGQQFFYEPEFRPITTVNNTCLEVDATDLYATGSLVKYNACDGEANQDWFMAETGYLMSRGGLCLTVNSSDFANSATTGALTLEACHTQTNAEDLSENKRFKFEGGSLVAHRNGSGNSLCVSPGSLSEPGATTARLMECDYFQDDHPTDPSRKTVTFTNYLDEFINDYLYVNW